jgi:Flp pilus assembly protein TadG
MRRRKHQRGSAFVETGFIFTVFAVMLLGIFDLGRVMFIHQALTERVRLAARWGAANGANNTTGIKNMVLYSASTQPNGATGYFGLNTNQIVVTHADSGTNSNRLTVSISGYQYKTVTPFFAKTLTGPKIEVTMALGVFN